jgi:hypothetical protein
MKFNGKKFSDFFRKEDVFFEEGNARDEFLKGNLTKKQQRALATMWKGASKAVEKYVENHKMSDSTQALLADVLTRAFVALRDKDLLE